MAGCGGGGGSSASTAITPVKDNSNTQIDTDTDNTDTTTDIDNTTDTDITTDTDNTQTDDKTPVGNNPVDSNPTPAVDTTAPVISTASSIYNDLAKNAVISINASDSGSGILSVLATVTTPSGSESKIALSYNSTSKVYEGLYENIPTNWTFASKEYDVEVVVTDNSNNSITVQTSFSVPGLELPPAPNG